MSKPHSNTLLHLNLNFKNIENYRDFIYDMTNLLSCLTIQYQNLSLFPIQLPALSSFREYIIDNVHTLHELNASE